jgi:hypothetical protein
LPPRWLKSGVFPSIFGFAVIQRGANFGLHSVAAPESLG